MPQIILFAMEMTPHSLEGDDAELVAPINRSVLAPQFVAGDFRRGSGRPASIPCTDAPRAAVSMRARREMRSSQMSVSSRSKMTARNFTTAFKRAGKAEATPSLPLGVSRYFPMFLEQAEIRGEQAVNSAVVQPKGGPSPSLPGSRKNTASNLLPGRRTEATAETYSARFAGSMAQKQVCSNTPSKAPRRAGGKWNKSPSR